MGRVNVIDPRDPAYRWFVLWLPTAVEPKLGRWVVGAEVTRRFHDFALGLGSTDGWELVPRANRVSVGWFMRAAVAELRLPVWKNVNHRPIRWDGLAWRAEPLLAPTTTDVEAAITEAVRKSDGVRLRRERADERQAKQQAKGFYFERNPRYD